MSKITPKNEKAKIRLARRLAIIFSLLFIAILIFAWFGLGPDKTKKIMGEVPACLKIRQECFDMEVADTGGERVVGLSGRSSLPKDRGMLFVFEGTGIQCFWMKNMMFMLDIIWVNEQKTIIKVEESVSPETYPNSFCSDNTKYVLEFNQGFAEKYGLKPGTKLQF